MLRFLLIGLMLISLGSAAQAQAVCSTVIDLSRMFTTLETVIDNNGTATSGQVRDLNAISRRNDAYSVNFNIENSPLASQRAIINYAFERAQIIQREIAMQGARSETALLPGTLASLHRASGVLSRMDCPPPVGQETEPGGETSLPRIANALSAGRGIGLLGKLKWFSIFAGAAALAGMIGIALVLYQKRCDTLARRYDCDVPATFILPGVPPTLGSGQIVDISRSGMKIAATGTSCPKVGDRLALHIGDTEHAMHVRWQNAFYFGGTFTHYLSAKAIKRLAGNTKASSRGQKSDRKRPAQIAVGQIVQADPNKKGRHPAVPPP